MVFGLEMQVLKVIDLNVELLSHNCSSAVVANV